MKENQRYREREITCTSRVEMRQLSLGQLHGSALNSQYRRGTRKKKNIKQKSFMIKVVKRAAGVAIKRFLKNLSNHYNMKENACLVCRTNGKGPHHRESVIYEIKCTRCDNVYTEETSKSAYTTGNKHTQSLNNFYSLYIFSI